MSTSQTIQSRIRDEIADLHVFFERWFRGEIPKTREEFVRVERALSATFRMISPRGDCSDRAELIRMLWQAHGSTEGRFEIEVRKVAEPMRADCAGAQVPGYLVTYEEWQWRGETQTARLSTAWIQDTGLGWVWHHVHETWMPDRHPSE